MAKNWTAALWLSETTVSGKIGDKTRSTLLKAVDTALGTFDTASDFNKLKALRRLQDAYDDWRSSKADASESIRNVGGNTLSDFEAWLRERQAALMPTRRGRVERQPELLCLCDEVQGGRASEPDARLRRRGGGVGCAVRFHDQL